MSATSLASQAMRSLVGDDFQHMIASTDYDTFIVVGAEKPPKEEFEAKLQELIDDQPLKELRAERNKRLAEVDWVFSTDYQIEDEKRSEWLAYRQALRDLPSTTGDPTNPSWPEKPSIPTGTTLDVNLENLKNISIPQNAQITLLQNAVHELTSRIEALENA